MVPHRWDVVPWLLWKAHRVVLRKSPFWRSLTLPGGRQLRVRYHSEGKVNYVFRVKGDARLLKVARTWFYRPEEAFDATELQASCALMNELAAWSLSGRGEYMGGGAYFMEDCGRALSKCVDVGVPAIERAFGDLERYSLACGNVPLDLHEDNWCWDGRLMRLVDIEATLNCRLESLREHELVRRRVPSAGVTNPASVLRAFLGEEKRLIVEYLRAKRGG
jgi:hypothetical protein